MQGKQLPTVQDAYAEQKRLQKGKVMKPGDVIAMVRCIVIVAVAASAIFISEVNIPCPVVVAAAAAAASAALITLLTLPMLRPACTLNTVPASTSVQQVYGSSDVNDVMQHQELLRRQMSCLPPEKNLLSKVSALVVQDGKYDRLLRLLYDDIQKYETEVAFFEFHMPLFGSLCLLAESMPSSTEQNDNNSDFVLHIWQELCSFWTAFLLPACLCTSFQNLLLQC